MTLSAFLNIRTRFSKLKFEEFVFFPQANPMSSSSDKYLQISKSNHHPTKNKPHPYRQVIVHIPHTHYPKKTPWLDAIFITLFETSSYLKVITSISTSSFPQGNSMNSGGWGFSSFKFYYEPSV